MLQNNTPGFTSGEGGPTDRRSINLATRANNWIANIRRSEHSPFQLKNIRDLNSRIFPNAILKSQSNRYNCYGLVFASRRTNILDGTEVDKILADDGYTLVTEEKDLCEGDIAIYRRNSSITHSAIIVKIVKDFKKSEFNIVALSQLGTGYECQHNVNEVPALYGRDIQYYTQRIILKQISQ